MKVVFVLLFVMGLMPRFLRESATIYSSPISYSYRIILDSSFTCFWHVSDTYSSMVYCNYVNTLTWSFCNWFLKYCKSLQLHFLCLAATILPLWNARNLKSSGDFTTPLPPSPKWALDHHADLLTHFVCSLLAYTNASRKLVDFLLCFWKIEPTSSNTAERWTKVSRHLVCKSAVYSTWTS